MSRLARRVLLLVDGVVHERLGSRSIGKAWHVPPGIHRVVLTWVSTSAGPSVMVDLSFVTACSQMQVVQGLVWRREVVAEVICDPATLPDISAALLWAVNAPELPELAEGGPIDLYVPAADAVCA